MKTASVTDTATSVAWTAKLAATPEQAQGAIAALRGHVGYAMAALWLSVLGLGIFVSMRGVSWILMGFFLANAALNAYRLRVASTQWHRLARPKQ